MDVRLDPATLAPALTTTFGPLADAWTHGFRSVDRAPWQPRRAAAVFDAALAGPLQWLGYVTFRCQGSGVREQGTGNREQGTGNGQPPAVVGDQTPSVVRPLSYVICPSSVVVGQDMWIQRPSQPTQPCPAPWSYGAAGELHVPITSADIDLVQALPVLQWVRTEGDRLIYRATSARLARAQAQGHSIAAIWEIIVRRAGPIPDLWRAAVPAASPLRLTRAVVLTGDPLQLTRAAQRRSVRRYIEHQLAPGVALVCSDRITALERALARQGVGVIGDRPPCSGGGAWELETQEPSSSPTPPDLHPGDTAALLVACAFYRRAAPSNMPLRLDELVEQRLRAALPPALRAATDQAIATLNPPTREMEKPGERETGRLGDWETDRHGDAALGRSGLGGGEQEAVTGRRSSVVGGRLSVVGNRKINPLSCDDMRRALRRTIDRQDVVTITYDRGGHGEWSTRAVRPLALEQHTDVWYLRAYCLVRNAERTFRIDRIGDLSGCVHSPRQDLDAAPKQDRALQYF
jgi:hypothetical protein